MGGVCEERVEKRRRMEDGVEEKLGWSVRLFWVRCDGTRTVHSLLSTRSSQHLVSVYWKSSLILPPFLFFAQCWSFYNNR